ncbi:hypothetical protein Lgee_0797 [Legionella geestiana]|uniref:Uncharacterized protein n=1 Tax=Legionella geestiana TaxID=45065 RepID=A0A0W0U2L8_9GAMM|nr:hypothetical protein Lgee_0797 [Legionella geestiana]STX53237.1 Uncharacterised protein [Legionella geestiana]
MKPETVVLRSASGLHTQGCLFAQQNHGVSSFHDVKRKCGALVLYRETGTHLDRLSRLHAVNT